MVGIGEAVAAMAGIAVAAMDTGTVAAAAAWIVAAAGIAAAAWVAAVAGIAVKAHLLVADLPKNTTVCRPKTISSSSGRLSAIAKFDTSLSKINWKPSSQNLKNTDATFSTHKDWH